VCGGRIRLKERGNKPKSKLLSSLAQEVVNFSGKAQLRIHRDPFIQCFTFLSVGISIHLQINNLSIKKISNLKNYFHIYFCLILKN